MKPIYKKILILAVLVIIAGLAITELVLKNSEKFKKLDFFESSEQKIYEAAVQIRDQKNSDPEEDARSCLKSGDVILVLSENHNWSKTERISSLILKIRMTEEQATKLTQSVEKEIEREEKSEEEDEGMVEKEVIKLRQYRVKIEELDFDRKKLSEGQPFEDKIFEWKDIVEKKKD